MNRMLAVARKDMLLIWKDKAALLSMFAVPLILMAILGSVFKFGDSTSNFSVPLPVVNQDGAKGLAFAEVLSSTGVLKVELHDTEEAVRKRLDDGESAPAYVVIPPGFGDALEGKGTAKLRLIRSPGNDARTEAVVQIVGKVVGGYSNTLIAQQASAAALRQVAPNLSPEQVQAAQGIVAQQVAELSRQPSVSVAASTAQTANVTPSPFDLIVPGYALMFALFSVTAGASSVLQEKEEGTFKRLLLTPLRAWGLIGGKMIAQYVISLIQITILMMIGIFGFGAHPGNVPALILLILVVPFAAVGLGMLLVSIVKTRRQLDPLATLVVLGFSAIGGSWFPLWLLPQWLQGVSKVTLTSWAMEGFNSIMIFGKGVGDIIPNLLVLLAYGAICFFIASRLFKVRGGEGATA